MNRNDLVSCNGNIYLAFLIKEVELEYAASRETLEVDTFTTDELRVFLNKTASDCLREVITKELSSRKEM